MRIILTFNIMHVYRWQPAWKCRSFNYPMSSMSFLFRGSTASGCAAADGRATDEATAGGSCSVLLNCIYLEIHSAL